MTTRVGKLNIQMYVTSKTIIAFLPDNGVLYADNHHSSSRRFHHTFVNYRIGVGGSNFYPDSSLNRSCTQKTMHQRTDRACRIANMLYSFLSTGEGGKASYRL